MSPPHAPAGPPLHAWRPWPGRRTLRLGSGLVLLGYIAAHLLNHALGLISVPAAERGLAIAVRVWHSLPGTVLLYGAVAVHVALALQAIYQRRTLRMPPLELLRMLLGLGIPLLLIGHVVQTRIAWDLYDAAPRYARVVWGLWLADGEGRQLAMLVPGWLHGCLGVHFAFGRRAWYQRLQLPLFALALLVPLLGGLGFLAMAKELAADAALRPRLDALALIAPAPRAALQQMREAVLALYLGAIGLVFGARLLRALVEQRRQVLIEIAYPHRSIRVPRGWSVLEASRSHHIAHVSMCGGRARCTTCRVRVTAGAACCPPPATAERVALQRIGAGADVRLACQLHPTGDIAVLPLLAPPGAHSTTSSGTTAERDVALLTLTWRNQAAFAREHLPQDLVFAAQSLIDAVCGALRGSGAVVAEARGDFVLAVIGLEQPLQRACIGALQAARELERTLAAVGLQHSTNFGSGLDCVVVVHAGTATVGTLEGSGMIVAGEAMDTLRALQAAAGDAAELVSVAVFDFAGEAQGASTAVVRGGVPAVARARSG